MTKLDKFLERFYRVGARLIVKLIYRCDFKGFENVPQEGGVLLIANHISYMDGMILNAASKRKMRFIIDDSIYHAPIVNHFMRLDRAIPIKPNKESVKAALDEVELGLKNGDMIAIFPEGQITYTGKLSRFKFGIEWMLKKQPVPVVPVVLIGLWDSIFSRQYLKQKNPFLPKKFRLRVKAICGKPISPEKATINYLQREIMRMYEMNNE